MNILKTFLLSITVILLLSASTALCEEQSLMRSFEKYFHDIDTIYLEAKESFKKHLSQYKEEEVLEFCVNLLAKGKNVKNVKLSRLRLIIRSINKYLFYSKLPILEKMKSIHIKLFLVQCHGIILQDEFEKKSFNKLVEMLSDKQIVSEDNNRLCDYAYSYLSFFFKIKKILMPNIAAHICNSSNNFKEQQIVQLNKLLSMKKSEIENKLNEKY
jgi:hypothetical protein